MENQIYLVLFLAVSGYIIYRSYKDLQKAIKVQKEENIKESLMTTAQKVEINTKQNKKHKIFICIALAGIILVLVLKNTFIGYFIGFGCMFLMLTNSMELGIRWSKKQSWNPKILIISFLLLLLTLSLTAWLYYPQLQFMYQDRVK